jgi:7-cyano-7-deazaguanine synthase in queuosine biosynthesis
MKKVLLYSGGLDSYCASKLQDYNILLHINLNTSTEEIERKRLPNNVITFNLEIGKFEVENSYLPLRNELMCLIASYYGEEIHLISLKGEGNDIQGNDKNCIFTSLTEGVLNYHWYNLRDKIPHKIIFPYKHLEKWQLLKLVIDKGYKPQEIFNDTFSCYKPLENGKECGLCWACINKWSAFALNNCTFMQDITEHIENFVENIEKSNKSIGGQIELENFKKAVKLYRLNKYGK